jgi:hypothetical protein
MPGSEEVMRISEYRKLLEQIEFEHGDLPVLKESYDKYGQAIDIEPESPRAYLFEKEGWKCLI